MDTTPKSTQTTAGASNPPDAVDATQGGLTTYVPQGLLTTANARVAELEAALVVERNLVTSAHRAENAKQKALDAERHRAKALQDDARALVNKLHHVHDSAAYRAVWTLWQAHAGRYKGPQYTDELAALEARLPV